MKKSLTKIKISNRMNSLKNKFRFIIAITLLMSLGFYNPSFSGASKIDELKSQIDEKTSSIGALEQEIKLYQIQLEKVGAEKKTLNNEIYRLNLDRKKISTDINLTDNKIQATSLGIQKLNIDISDKESRVEKNNIALAESIRLMNEFDSNSLVEILLSKEDLSEFWDGVEYLQRFQVSVRERTNELLALKSSLEEDKSSTEVKERELVSFRSELSDKKEIVDYSKQEKDQLLSVTSNKESNYKAALAEKQRLMEAFLDEIKSLESQIKIEIDPTSIPDSGYGVLEWPLEKIRITQYFGNTDFSTKNPQVYNGKGHTGIDLGASSGTKVMSSLGGVVKGTGNTDTVPPKCYSYGKWVLIEHYNGLTTLYAHLSLIKVVEGQVVNTGDIIGYSGNTGYSTGPHLHYSVYASKGVQITKFTNSINCKDKYIPLAPYDAYLNPLSFLPKY